MKTLDEKIWDYLEGFATDQESQELESLLKQDAGVRKRFDEIKNMESYLNLIDLEEPSMSFTANVMQQVYSEKTVKVHVNNWVILSIAGLFVLTFLICLLSAVYSVNWNIESSDNLILQSTWLNKTEILSGTYKYLFYLFIMIDFAVLLKLIDNYLNRKRLNLG